MVSLPLTSYPAGVMLLARRRPFYPSAAHDKFLSICTAFGGYTEFGIVPTDITEFALPEGKLYLLPLIDCFDGLVVNWTAGRSPNAALVNTMLDQAIAALPEGQHPIIHTDRGCHYRCPGWIERMERAGLTRSMFPKGCSPDNSACEGFFWALKK